MDGGRKQVVVVGEIAGGAPPAVVAAACSTPSWTKVMAWLGVSASMGQCCQAEQGGMIEGKGVGVGRRLERGGGEGREGRCDFIRVRRGILHA